MDLSMWTSPAPYFLGLLVSKISKREGASFSIIFQSIQDKSYRGLRHILKILPIFVPITKARKDVVLCVFFAVQSLSCVRFFVTPWNAECQASLPPRKDKDEQRVCSVIQSCLSLWCSKDCSLPGSSVHGTFQARILEWVAISNSIPQPNSSTK